MQHIRFPLLGLLFLSFTACSSLQPPTASVQSVSAGDVSADGFAVNLGVQLSNPNAVELPLTAADYQLKLGGIQVLDDTAKPNASIPAHGSSLLVVPMHLKFQDLLKAEQSIVQGKGEVPYDLDGGLSFGAGGVSDVLGQKLRVPLHNSGTLSLTPILKNSQALASNPAVRELAMKIFSNFSGFRLSNP